MSNRVYMAGLIVRDITFDVLSRYLDAAVARRRKVAIFFANANFVVRCQELKPALRGRPNVHIVPDGLGIDLASKALRGRPFRENLNGTDFVPRFLATRRRPLSIYLLGGTGEVVERTAETFAALAQIRVAGRRDGYSFHEREEGTIAEINAARPDVLLVALGNPLQEQWILDRMDRIDASVFLGVGALFDFVSGHKARAPILVRRLRLEWIYRLALEPRRLLARYTVGILHFALVVARDRRPGGAAGEPRTASRPKG